MGLFDFLGGDNDSKTTVQLPKWYEEAAQSTVDFGQRAAKQPFQPYRRGRVAGFTPQQKRSFDVVDEGTGIWKQPVQGALSLAEGVGERSYAPGALSTGRFDTEAAQRYMNPYIDTVADATLRRYDEGRSKEKNALQASASLSGAFGGGRHGVAEAEFARGSAEDRALIASDLYRDAYDTAAGIYTSDEGRALEADRLTEAFRQSGYDMNQGYDLAASERMGALGQLTSGLNFADAQALLGSGEVQRALEQEGLDVGYEDYLIQRDWPLRQLNILTGALSGTQLPTTTVTEGPKANTAAQIGGALASGIGLASQFF